MNIHSMIYRLRKYHPGTISIVSPNTGITDYTKGITTNTSTTTTINAIVIEGNTNINFSMANAYKNPNESRTMGILFEKIDYTIIVDTNDFSGLTSDHKVIINTKTYKIAQFNTLHDNSGYIIKVTEAAG